MMNNIFYKIFASPRPPMLLAPMAGFTDAPFRRMCFEAGADMATSEMISAKALVYKDKKTASLAKIYEGEKTALQLFGHEPEVIAEAAAMLASGRFDGCEYGETPVAIDINMGCPVKKIISCGDGSALMRSPELCMRITEAAVRGARPFGIPVTVKMRIGWSEDEKNVSYAAQAAAAGGAAAVTVHARTRERMYAPGIEMKYIAAVREALPESVFVIGNGDISNARDALKMLHETHCNAVSVGRAALGDPWIFTSYCNGTEAGATQEMRQAAATRLVRELAAEYGEERGVKMARGRAAHFLRSAPGAAAKRAALCRAATEEEAVAAINAEA